MWRLRGVFLCYHVKIKVCSYLILVLKHDCPLVYIENNILTIKINKSLFEQYTILFKTVIQRNNGSPPLVYNDFS